MADKELLEKASDAVGGGETGVSKSADPVATGDAHANRKADKKDNGETVAKGQGDADKITPTMGGNATAEANAATIKAKPSAASVKEEIDGLFGEDLSEEFKEKATVLFEAAVAARVADEKEVMQAQLDADKVQLEESFAKAKEELVEELSGKVSEYLDYVVEQWMDENQVAIDSSLNTEIAQEFMEKLKGLFEESYMEVPEQKLDIVDELATKVEELETKLNQTIDENIKLKSSIDVSTKEEIFKEVSEGLALTQAEKFKTLSEGVEFGDSESYRRKLEIVKAQYFTEAKVAVKSIEENEIMELDEEVQQPKVDGPVSNYLAAISRTIKK
jgi:quinol monooxygenase YgiN